MAVREKAGIFDVSHMGRFRFTGKDAFPILNKILPRNLLKLADGRCVYSYLLDENGGMLDDCVTMRKSEDFAIFVCNAGPRVNDWNWMINFIDGEKQKNPKLDIPSLKQDITSVCNKIALNNRSQKGFSRPRFKKGPKWKMGPQSADRLCRFVSICAGCVYSTRVPKRHHLSALQAFYVSSGRTDLLSS